MLYRKGPGKEAKLSYGFHLLMENRHGLVAEMNVFNPVEQSEGAVALGQIKARARDSGIRPASVGAAIMIAAMQTDSARVMTCREPVATLLTAMDIKVHPHDMSHYHTTLGEKLDASQRRDIAQSELLAGFPDKLKATKEADGSTLFDNIALAYGSNIRTGHELSNCPTILTGRAAGHELSNCPTILTGRAAGLKLGHNIIAPKDTPLCNAWLTMLHGIGVNAERRGDSTGVLKELQA